LYCHLFAVNSGIDKKMSMSSRVHLGRIVAVFLLMICALPSQAQNFPAGFGRVLVAGNITSPTALAFLPDGRIFVCEQTGAVRVIKDGALLAQPFLKVSVSSTGERGLLGIAIDPDFETNGYVYVYYTVATAPLHNRISRFTADGDVAAPGSEILILRLDNLSTATNHNGGAMHFGLDGKLYVAIGENARRDNAQNLDNYLGKFLRMNSDGSVPEGNPFTEGTGQKQRIWSYGLRNPYTFAIHPESGRIMINDVGQNTWEEINDATIGGQNFGWPAQEGMPNAPGTSAPVLVYSHGSGDGKGCAITGGTFFSPAATDYPGTYYGKYFYQDYCNGWINYMDPDQERPQANPFATNLGNSCLALTTGQDGNLYYLSRPDKALYKIVYQQSTPPFITHDAKPTSVTECEDAVFEVRAIGSAPLQYAWYKDDVLIPDATGPQLVLEDVQPDDAGTYKVVVSNLLGMAEGAGATLEVVGLNDLPVASITAPERGSAYSAGETVTFSGTAIDEEDGELPAEAFEWNVFFHSEVDTVEELTTAGVREGSFVVPDEGETSTDVWYRIVLTVSDSDGLKHSDTVDIVPRTSTLHLGTTPAGLQLVLDGETLETPVSVPSVEGMKRTLDVISPQVVGETTYEFDHWVHGGEPQQVLNTPPNDTTLTAVFTVVVAAEGDRVYKTAAAPNPVTDGVRAVEVTVPSERAQAVTISIVNMLSRELTRVSHTLSPGANRIMLPVDHLANGVYSVILQAEKSRRTVRLLVAR
jgi:glucose/arabinose dehydrogenase